MPGIKNPHLEGGSFLWEGGPTGILLVHGFRATTVEVRLLGQRLHQAGYTVSGPLLPGHGTTVTDLNTCRWEDWVDTVNQAYSHLRQQCDQVFVGGESMGSLLTLYLASLHPEAAGVLSYAPALRVKGMERVAFLSLFVSVVNRNQADDELPWQGYTGIPLRGAAELYQLMRATRRALPQVCQPVIIFQGRLDRTIVISSAEEVYRRIGSSDKSLHWMDDSRHCIILDKQLDDVTRMTLEFLARISSVKQAPNANPYRQS